MMLVPMLSVAGAWVAPDGCGVGRARSHFAERAAERGVTSIHGDLLKWAVEKAVADRRSDLAELVFSIDAVSRVFRVILPEGAFYPIIAPNGNCVTLFSAREIRQTRHARKGRLKRAGKRERALRGAQ
jgi:hypothetical protein